MTRKTRWALAALTIAAFGSSVATADDAVTYTYDGRGRLVKVKHAATSTVNQNVQACYKYDKAGNRINVTTSVPSPNTPAACPQ